MRTTSRCDAWSRSLMRKVRLFTVPGPVEPVAAEKFSVVVEVLPVPLPFRARAELALKVSPPATYCVSLLSTDIPVAMPSLEKLTVALMPPVFWVKPPATLASSAPCWFQRRVWVTSASVAGPAVMLSAPPPPVMVSLPDNPVMVSALSVPVRVSLVEFPRIDAMTVSAHFAPTPKTPGALTSGLSEECGDSRAN